VKETSHESQGIGKEDVQQVQGDPQTRNRPGDLHQQTA
jgi:hypothetical protein